MFLFAILAPLLLLLATAAAFTADATLFPIGSDVERWKWQPGRPFAQQVLARRQPVIIEGGTAELWAARKWTWQSLQERISALPAVRSSADNVFLLRAPEGNTRNKTLHVPGEYVQEITFRSRRMAEFVTAGQSRVDGDNFLYYSGPLSYWGDSLLADTTPRELFFCPDDSAPAGVESPAVIWMGHAGVTAHTHYDVSHNFFTQLMGEKTFFLFTPQAAAQQLYLFPHAHPSYRQSQVDFRSPDLHSFPAFANVSALRAKLLPGDSLYVPPFWPHRVVSDTMGVGVSIVSPSDEEACALALKHWSLPFGPLLSVDERALGTKLFLDALLDAQPALPSAAQVAAALLQQRYAAIEPALASTYTMRPKWRCGHNKKRVRKLANAYAQQELNAEAKRIAQALSSLSDNTSVHLLLMMDYLEDSARDVVGTQNIPIFLRRCWKLPAAAAGKDEL